MSDFVVRRAVEADARSIARVHVEAWQWAYRDLVPDDYLNSLDIDARTLIWEGMLQDTRGPRAHVAVVSTGVVGFVSAGPSRDEDASPGTGEIEAIYLLPAHIGTGIGSCMWHSALAQLGEEGKTSVTIWVLDSNERGRRFYERAGMSPDGAVKDESLDGFPITEIRYRTELD
ncbi:GNAT family N-acetyltransferase [Arthrobacter monumenti]